jgi:hypothetical protein
MATEAQAKANRENAQYSTGATIEANSARSSQNATRHGYTGRSLVLKPEEIDEYNAHIAAYLADYPPTTVRQRQLVQQKADLDWSLHQIDAHEPHQFPATRFRRPARRRERFDPVLPHMQQVLKAQAEHRAEMDKLK